MMYDILFILIRLLRRNNNLFFFYIINYYDDNELMIIILVLWRWCGLLVSSSRCVWSQNEEVVVNVIFMVRRANVSGLIHWTSKHKEGRRRGKI